MIASRYMYLNVCRIGIWKAKKEHILYFWQKRYMDVRFRLLPVLSFLVPLKQNWIHFIFNHSSMKIVVVSSLEKKKSQKKNLEKKITFQLHPTCNLSLAMLTSTANTFMSCRISSTKPGLCCFSTVEVMFVVVLIWRLGRRRQVELWFVFSMDQSLVSTCSLIKILLLRI